MTIDERIEALARRHEALSQSVELLLASQRETDEKVRHLAIIAEQNEVRAQAIEDSVQRLADIAGQNEIRAGELTNRAIQAMDAIARLANIATNHEQRLEDLESR
jgi:hypothetical protein